MTTIATCQSPRIQDSANRNKPKKTDSPTESEALQTEVSEIEVSLLASINKNMDLCLYCEYTVSMLPVCED